MKKRKQYSAPLSELSTSRLRHTILAGSNQLTGGDNAYDGTDHSVVSNPPSMPFEAKKRVMDF